jgi:hypothetical protein
MGDPRVLFCTLCKSVEHSGAFERSAAGVACEATVLLQLRTGHPTGQIAKRQSTATASCTQWVGVNGLMWIL